MSPQLPGRQLIGRRDRRCPTTGPGGIAETRAVGVREVVSRLCGRIELCPELTEAGAELFEILEPKRSLFGRLAHVDRPRTRRAFNSRIFSWTAGRKPAASNSASQRSGVMKG